MSDSAILVCDNDLDLMCLHGFHGNRFFLSIGLQCSGHAKKVKGTALTSRKGFFFDPGDPFLMVLPIHVALAGKGKAQTWAMFLCPSVCSFPFFVSVSWAGGGVQGDRLLQGLTGNRRSDIPQTSTNPPLKIGSLKWVHSPSIQNKIPKRF